MVNVHDVYLHVLASIYYGIYVREHNRATQQCNVHTARSFGLAATNMCSTTESLKPSRRRNCVGCSSTSDTSAPYTGMNPTTCLLTCEYLRDTTMSQPYACIRNATKQNHAATIHICLRVLVGCCWRSACGCSHARTYSILLLQSATCRLMASFDLVPIFCNIPTCVKESHETSNYVKNTDMYVANTMP